MTSGIKDKVVVITGARVDVMINNAGLMQQTPLERLKVDEWDNMVDVNIKGVIYGIAAALPHMQRQKSGPHHQRLFGGWPQGHSSGHRLFGDKARRPGDLGRADAGGIRTTVISPGAVATELPGHITDPDSARNIQQFYAGFAIPADSFARAVAFAMNQPEDVDVNEVLFRPTSQLL